MLSQALNNPLSADNKSQAPIRKILTGLVTAARPITDQSVWNRGQRNKTTLKRKLMKEMNIMSIKKIFYVMKVKKKLYSVQNIMKVKCMSGTLTT